MITVRIKLFARLPRWKEIVPVYSVIVLILYTWSIAWFFYRVPSWLLFLNIKEILAVYSYVLAANFLESVLVTAVILSVCFVLPSKWFLEQFIYRGALSAVLGLGFMMYVAGNLQFYGMDKFPAATVKWYPAALFGIFLSTYLLEVIPRLPKTIELLADRAIIFTFLYIPLTAISVISIMIRHFI